MGHYRSPPIHPVDAFHRHGKRATREADRIVREHIAAVSAMTGRRPARIYIPESLYECIHQRVYGVGTPHQTRVYKL